jgi:hypothetical protein
MTITTGAHEIVHFNLGENEWAQLNGEGIMRV